MFTVGEIKLCFRMNGSGNDFMVNFYDLQLLMFSHKLSFLQNHLIFKYINILTLC
jgi:hypothetical protein